jgi:DNA-directed RNA polymerase subunit L
MPVSQCSYTYTLDTDEERRQELFEKWLLDAKKVTYDPAEADSEKIKALRREYETMEIARCYLRDENGEPYSFDFTVESVGVLDVPYIVRRACEVGEAMVGRYVNVETGPLPEELTISPADGRVIGFDFLFRGHDHTLGNLIQTWMVANLIDGPAEPKITFAGYKVPHPLRDEMVLRIGVADGNRATARLALAMACRGCVELFRQMRTSWEKAAGGPSANLLRRATAAAAAGTEAAPAPSANLLRRATAAAAASKK